MLNINDISILEFGDNKLMVNLFYFYKDELYIKFYFLGLLIVEV